MAGTKRDRQGNSRAKDPGQPAPRNQFTSVFETFRDELDEHHDRRERLVKLSRDVTALSKKVVHTLGVPLPANIAHEVSARLDEIKPLLGSMAADLRGIDRHRYAGQTVCVEELVEALAFAHYLRTQRLVSPADVQAAVPFDVTPDEYLRGVLDLSGEMMRFATGNAGRLLRDGGGGNGDGHGTGTGTGTGRRRTVVQDMQELGSVFASLPPRRGDRGWDFKIRTLNASVLKVERLGYGMRVRGSERPAGWMPDTAEEQGADSD